MKYRVIVTQEVKYQDSIIMDFDTAEDAASFMVYMIDHSSYEMSLELTKVDLDGSTTMEEGGTDE